MIDLRDLRALAALRAFTDDDLQSLLALAPACNVGAGSVLYLQGEPASSCFLIVRGQVQVERTRRSGTQIVTTLRPGTLVGQIALIDRGKRTATVRAATAVEGLEIAGDIFDQLLAGARPLALAFQEQLALAGIRQFRGVMEQLANLPAAAHPADAEARDAGLTRAQASLGESGEQAIDFNDVDLDDIRVVFDSNIRRQRW